MDSIREREARRQLDVLRLWKFGEATLDEMTLELRVSGHLVALERKALEILLLLLHHAGEAVEKSHVIETVWHGRPVTDAAIARCLGALRRVLDDHDRKIIETVDGHAYRLTTPVQVLSQLPASLLPDDVREINDALR